MANLFGVSTFIALLRGVNVGGRTVRMEDLRAVFAALGHRDVQTYIQSGNVIFRSATADAAAVRRGIEERLARDLGGGVAVLLRTPEELAETAAGNPFLQRRADPGRLYATFLDKTPVPGRLQAIRAEEYLPDEFHARGREIYLHCPGGYGRTKLNNAFFEARLGVGATTRNWNTVTRLLELAGSAAV